MHVQLNRIIVILAVLSMSYFIVMLGDTVHGFLAWGIDHYSETSENQASGLWCTWIVSIIVGIFAVVLWCVSIGCSLIDKPDDYQVLGLSFPPMLYLFGLVAAPISVFGSKPGDWASQWDFILVAAFVPMVLVIKNIVLDMCTAHKKPS